MTYPEPLERQSEVTHITDLLKEWKFEPEEIPFRQMIFDLIAPEKIVVDKCIPVFEELALLNENPFGHLVSTTDIEEEIDLNTSNLDKNEVE